MARVYQEFETLRLVVNEALGGNSGESGGPSVSDNTVGSYAELEAAFQELGGSLG